LGYIGGSTTEQLLTIVNLYQAEHASTAGDLQGVSYQDFAERTQKHGQRRVFEAQPGNGAIMGMSTSDLPSGKLT